MKKVCTVTYHNVGINYGQTLQAYALQAALNKMGYDNILLNYNSPLGQYKYHRLFFLNRYADAGANCFYKQLKFDFFIKKYIKLTDACFNSEQIRGVLDKQRITHLVCGSDQIWNPSGMDAVYFLEYGNKKENRVKIAYAASMCSKGVMNQYKAKHTLLKHLIEKVDYISMREQSGVEIVEELTGKDAVHVLDPTLLLNRKHWCRIARKPKIGQKYMVIFFYGNVKPYIKKIQKIASLAGIHKIINIETSPDTFCASDWSNRRNVGPEEFIGYLANASAVCTDSFHGTAFSISLNREIYSFARVENKSSGNYAVSNGSRISDIMDKLEIENRWIQEESEIKELVPIDYNIVNQRLNRERKKSIRFLRNALEGRKYEEADH